MSFSAFCPLTPPSSLRIGSACRRGHVWEARGEKALNRGTRASGVRRKGTKCLVCIIEQIIDMESARHRTWSIVREPSALDKGEHPIIYREPLDNEQPAKGGRGWVTQAIRVRVLCHTMSGVCSCRRR